VLHRTFDKRPIVAKEGAAHGAGANVICPGFVRTPPIEMQIPEQARELGISEANVIKTMMLKETVAREFTTTQASRKQRCSLQLSHRTR
jgi:3-hydroxybutyrate dehydrogenase